MPRVMRTVGRTAVIAGTATAVSGRVAHRQANRWAEQAAPEQAAPPAAAQPVPPPSPAPVSAESLAKLKQLAELRDAGVLSEAEFEQQKALILSQGG
jgi:transcriptional regulator GlxA family with amidase domain